MFSAILIYILAVMSPGANFILVSRIAAANSISSGIGASIGIWMVGLLFSTSSVFGLSVIINHFPKFGVMATILGAIYLIYIAYILFKSATTSRKDLKREKGVNQIGFFRAILMGVATNIVNVKTIAFMVSIFASFLATSKTFGDKVMVVSICSTFEILWYSLMALIFGRGHMQEFYLKYNRQIDIGLALFLVVFAVQNFLSLSGKM